MKSIFISIFLIAAFRAYPQEHDRYWIFGTDAGIEFGDSVRLLKSECNNFEMNASLSDQQGNLLFYFDRETFYLSKIKDGDFNEIANGTGLNTYSSVTSGPAILPTHNERNYFAFYLSEEHLDDSCQFIHCTKLFYSRIVANDDTVFFERKNRILLSNLLSEKLSVVKHADGSGWWIVAYANENSKNRFYKFEVIDTVILGPFIQDAGVITTNFFDVGGQMQFSKNGNHLALVRDNSKVCEIYDFDRCTGMLSNMRRLNIQIQEEPYGIEFSPNGKLLYLTTGWLGGFNGSKLLQIDLTQTILSPLTVGTSNYVFGQLQLGPNGKIYLANQCTNGFPEQNFLPCNQYLSVINHPDSSGLACDFQPFSFYLGDSSKSTLGLPNMPNYNLGALSIYQADAGIDTVICTEDTTVKGVLLGVPAVSGVAYSWHPSDSLNHTNIAQPFANPTVSTWYHLTVTDTSIKYSCQSRTDSVFVEVKDCIVGIESPQLSVNSPQIKIYPNPANEIIHVVLFDTRYSILKTEIFDVTGQLLQRQTTNRKQQTAINTQHLAKGLHFLRVELENGQQAIRKIVIQ